MNVTPRAWIVLSLALPGLAGCSPDGPKDFYRTALQARAEFVDSMSKIVDEDSAKAIYPRQSKLYKERIDALNAVVVNFKKAADPVYGKMTKETFNPANLNAVDKTFLMDAVEASIEYAESRVPTEKRLDRELQRLRRLANVIALEKAQAQLAARQAVTASPSADAPNISQITDGIQGFDKVIPPISILPDRVTVEQLVKLAPNLKREDLAKIVQMTRGEGFQMGELTPPPLPPYPAWAVDVNKRANLNLIRD